MNFSLSGFLLAALMTLSLSMQAQAFGGPFNQSTCEGAGVVINFDATFFNDEDNPQTVSSFQVTTSDIVLTLAPAPALNSGQTFTLAGNLSGSGAIYDLTVVNDGLNYSVRLSIVSGITVALNNSTHTFTAIYGGMSPPPNLSSSTATLTVNTPLTITIDPSDLVIGICESETIDINASTPTGFPNSYQWLRNGVPIGGATSEDLSIANATTAETGSYQLRISGSGCPDVTSVPASVVVAPSAVITETDMAAKEMGPGSTASFEVQIDNVDASSEFTWTIDGNNFTINDVPATITVGGNTIEVVDIVNMGTGPTSVSSVLSLANNSAMGAPFYQGNVGFNATNNNACATAVGTVVSGVTSIFPVEWQSFEAKLENEWVRLQWVTATEQNNEGFYVQRSLDGRDFTTIDFIVGAGTSEVVQPYQWLDREIPKGVSSIYYRLRQIDFDGNEGFSTVVQVEVPTNTTVLGPVVVKGSELSMLITTPTDEPLEYQVFDVRGLLLYQGQTLGGQPEVEVRFPAPVAFGTYFVRVVDRNEVLSRAFVR